MSPARPPRALAAVVALALLAGGCATVSTSAPPASTPLPAAAPSGSPSSGASGSAPSGASGSASPSASGSPTPAATSSLQAQQVKRAAIVRHVKAYLKGRDTTAAVVVRDLVTGEVYRYRGGAHYDSASVVKVAVLAATLRRAASAKRSLTSRERSLLRAMITLSDNAATTSLYRALGGRTAMARFYAAAGMDDTTPGPAGYWGLTQITAADQVTLLDHLVEDTGLLNAKSRRYARGLMADVDADQDWGVSAGPAKAGATVQLKNGWLPRASHGWRVHSVGHVKGEGRDYLVAVLTHDDPTMRSGVATVEGISRIVWRDLAPP